MDELLSIGASHATAPVEIRERLALPGPRAVDFARTLVAAQDVREAVAVSTCGRVEVYVAAPDARHAERAALGLLASHAGMSAAELAPAVRVARNCDAARHLFRVASGLESMIVGEAQIQGQVKRAHEVAAAARTTGPLTDRVFRGALAAGRRVRRETGIGTRRLSVPAVAVERAGELLGDLTGRRAAIIGTGETAELTARALVRDGARLVFLASRRPERARVLAERFGGEAAGLGALDGELARADVVVSATASPRLLIAAADVARALPARGGRPLVLLDLAVPRDVDPACAGLPGAVLIGVDDLRGAVERNRAIGYAESRRAEQVIEDEIRRLAAALASLEALPTLAALRRHAQQIAEQVVRENAGRWESASGGDLERVERLAAAVAGRLLHEPTVRVKELRGEHAHAGLEVLRELFGLPGEERPAGEAESWARAAAEASGP